VQEVGHFFFVHPNKVDNLVVLFSQLLKGLADVVLHLVEQEKVVTEGLYHSLDLFL
jgi:hypothetical protein